MLRVGLAQINIEIGNREANFQRVEEWMCEHYSPAQEKTAIVLPEIWDVGYDLENAATLADPEGNLAAKFLGSLARKYGVWFVGGSVMAGTPEGPVNRAQVINPEGALVGYYDKAHLIPLMDEPKFLRAGNAKCSFDWEGTEAGCVICYDIRFCEWLRRYAVEGAEVLFVSAEWPKIRIDHWKAILRVRAIENMMYVVACNRVGESKGTLFGGASMVVDPWGEVLYEGAEGEEGRFLSFDPAKVAEIREHLQVFNMRRPELYSCSE